MWDTKLPLDQAVLALSSLTQLSFFPNDTLITTADVSLPCLTAMNATVSCDAYLFQLATADLYQSLGNATIQASVCDATCGRALSSYRSSVVEACSNDPMPWEGIPATYLVDFVWAYYNGTCLKDPTTGEWCIDYVSRISSTLTDETPVTSLPKSQLCSPCIIALFQHQQSTPFSNYDDTMAAQWATVQSSCAVGGPTTVLPPYATPTSLAGHAPTDGSQATPTCLSGNSYKVKSGDNPQTIAEANRVATGTLMILNDIIPDGSNLFVDQTLCLPQQCKTYLVQSGDTCWALASANGLSFTELLVYNPSLNSECSNLLSGINVCLDLPGEPYNGTAIAGATATQTAPYATATAAIPTNAAHGSTRKCGKWYTVESGDYCQIVALNNKISLPLFTTINPSINSTCGNLVEGLAYCVWPTLNWNATASAPIPPPAPTPSGTIGQCYEWHVVKAGDGCYAIEQMYEITMAQLQAWNPDLHSDCGNLLLGEAYCVAGSATAIASASYSPVIPVASSEVKQAPLELV